MPSNRLIFFRPLLLLPSVFPSIRVFPNKSALHIRPEYWSFSISISPSSEYSGLISFRIDWFDLLAVQRTCKSLSNTSVQNHKFFGAQLSLWSNSHIYTWVLENHSKVYVFVGKVMSLLFNMLSGFVPELLRLSDPGLGCWEVMFYPISLLCGSPVAFWKILHEQWPVRVNTPGVDINLSYI